MYELQHWQNLHLTDVSIPTVLQALATSSLDLTWVSVLEPLPMIQSA